jgi:hypothetical protein
MVDWLALLLSAWEILKVSKSLHIWFCSFPSHKCLDNTGRLFGSFCYAQSLHQFATFPAWSIAAMLKL